MPKTCSDSQRLTLHGPTMGTRWSVTCDAPPGLDAQALRADLAAAVEQVDAQMSPWKPGSTINALNQAPTGQWHALTAPVFEVIPPVAWPGR